MVAVDRTKARAPVPAYNASANNSPNILLNPGAQFPESQPPMFYFLSELE